MRHPKVIWNRLQSTKKSFVVSAILNLEESGVSLCVWRVSEFCELTMYVVNHQRRMGLLRAI